MNLAKLRPYLMVAPAMVVFAVFSLLPIGYMLYLSFFKWNMMGPKVFVGIRNYADLASSGEFAQVLGNSLYFMALSVILSVAISLLLALFLRRNTKMNRLLQASVFAPYIISLVSISFIWMWFMDSDFGLLNYLLGLFGLAPVGWLDDPRVALNSLVMVSVWKGLGFDTLIFVSALQSIPAYLYEAAALDKARPLAVFRSITLPMLSPTLFFLALTNIIASFKAFETVSIMTQGGPVNSTNTLVHYIYQYGFQFFKIGYASAVGVILMLLVGIFTLLYFRMLDRRVHYR
ncbi:MAG: sugar ABC transporter permease [Rectinemataceae bacterium]|nr:sugar ABC transporter permease [Rectinemataceae bacterium]